MTTDLRALLGDRMEPTLDLADEALQGVCGRPDSCWKHGHWDDAEAVLAAVLPDLLATARREGQAEAWDEGHDAGFYARGAESDLTDTPNPYRSGDPR